MKWIFSLIIIFMTFSYAAMPTNALIFLPAIILIPIAKIVAIVVGGFAIPALGTSVIWSKLFGKSTKKAIVVAAILLIIIAIVLFVSLRMLNPDRPWI